MKAIWNGATLADAPREDLIRIEGNWYFPPSSIVRESFQETDRHTECFWIGTASYYTVSVNDQLNKDAAWYYPEPMDSSVEKVGHDFKDYVAFWRGIEVVE